MRKHISLPDEKTAFSYLEKYQKNFPEEYRIKGEDEHISARKILSAFCKTTPKRHLWYKFKKFSATDLFLIDLYNFFYEPMPKAVIHDLNLYTEQLDVKEEGRRKTIIIYLSTDGIVLSKLELFACNYMKNNPKLGRCVKGTTLEDLKRSIRTGKTTFSLSSAED